MKKQLTSLLLSIVLCLLFTGCMSSYYTNAPKQLIDVPLVAHQKNVDLYFNSDLPKNQNFLKVIGISAVGEQYTDYNTLVNYLKAQGQRYGVDAIIYIGSSQTERSNQTVLDALADATSKAPVKPANFYSYQASALNGIGIKYADSMSYIRHFVKTKRVYAYDPADSTVAPALSSTTRFSMMKEELDTQPAKAKPFYDKYVKAFSLDFLLREEKNWTYKTDELGRIKVRKKSLNDSPIFKCKFTYHTPTSGLLQSITVIDRHVFQAHTYLIRLVYGADNTVLEKRVYTKENKLQFRETLSYDTQKRLDTATLYQITEKREVPIAKTVYEYYSLDDVIALASK